MKMSDIYLTLVYTVNLIQFFKASNMKEKPDRGEGNSRQCIRYQLA